MTIGIYAIINKTNGKVYIGKSVNVRQRIATHGWSLRKVIRNKKQSNRHLHGAVQKYGWSNFETIVLEEFRTVDETTLADRELYWMMLFRSTDRARGYNLRMDSSTHCFVHAETRALYSLKSMGEKNPNFGNRWSDEAKQKMSAHKKIALADKSIYGPEWRKKISEGNRADYAKNPGRRTKIAAVMSVMKTKYRFNQLTREGVLIRTWKNIHELLTAHPDYKRQVIYSVCDGWKKTYKGFVWTKELI